MYERMNAYILCRTQFNVFCFQYGYNAFFFKRLLFPPSRQLPKKF